MDVAAHLQKWLSLLPTVALFEQIAASMVATVELHHVTRLDACMVLERFPCGVSVPTAGRNRRNASDWLSTIRKFLKTP
jgi:hypothetical protein